MVVQLPYCGAPPLPGSLLHRFNLDPVLIIALTAVAALHIVSLRDRRGTGAALGGWLIVAAALLSPLCALSVALFSARVAQHMILVLCAAPLLAAALPEVSVSWARRGAWFSTAAFFVALWFWHMPGPYEATFTSTPVYWLMHLTLFGSSIILWRSLLRSPREAGVDALFAGAVTSMQMGFLGAILTTASRPLFFAHLSTTQMWGMTPLQDQALGGVFMWVPGILLFLGAALYALERLRSVAARAKPA
ncbi:MAG TPA: cytochrome c oxidase assembly protein [Steroidobacteraceae bacterium]|nr:cytochrome c oxidase assembly protein [Steroidobacteraceae bacterium]